jgi:hypothetical protein
VCVFCAKEQFLFFLFCFVSFASPLVLVCSLWWLGFKSIWLFLLCFSFSDFDRNMSDFEYLTLKSIAHSYKTSTPSELVSKYYPLWADNKFAWITLLPLDVLLKRCAELELQKPHLRGELWGVPFAVKDNIHYPLVAPTTCACKTYQYQGSIKKRCHVCCVVNGTNDKGF